jgi:hypothetical protein
MTDRFTKPGDTLAPPPVVRGDLTRFGLQHPLTSLAILAPLCLLGEILRLTAGATPESRQLLADPLLVELGSLVGMQLPFVSCIVLILWCLVAQYTGRHPWILPTPKILAHAFGWAAVWCLCRLAVSFMCRHVGADSIAGTAGLLISGAVQEELLFRGVLLGAGIALVRCYDWPDWVLYGLILPLTAVFFSLAHTVLVNHHPGAELFAWKPFFERMFAGGIYGYAFLRQGLAVSTLAHLGYLISLEIGLGRFLA